MGEGAKKAVRCARGARRARRRPGRVARVPEGGFGPSQLNLVHLHSINNSLNNASPDIIEGNASLTNASGHSDREM